MEGREGAMDSVRRGSRHPRATLRYMLDGEPITIAEIAEIADMSTTAMWRRLVVVGMTPEEAISIPKKCKARLKLNGRYVTYREVERRLYITYATLYRRAQRHGTTVQEEIDAEWRRQHEV